YSPAGQIENVEQAWETWNSTTHVYNVAKVLLKNSCDHDSYTSLKPHSYFYEADATDPTTWSSARTETYTYDTLGQLASAQYSSGGSTDSWTYDAAGNRSDATVDNLNRATTIGGVSRSYDILGN